MLEDMNLVQAKGPNSGPNLRYVRRPNSSLELQSGPKSKREIWSRSVLRQRTKIILSQICIIRGPKSSLDLQACQNTEFEEKNLVQITVAFEDSISFMLDLSSAVFLQADFQQRPSFGYQQPRSLVSLVPVSMMPTKLTPMPTQLRKQPGPQEILTPLWVKQVQVTIPVKLSTAARKKKQNNKSVSKTVKNCNQGIISGTESGAGGVGCGENVQRKRRINI